MPLFYFILGIFRWNTWHNKKHTLHKFSGRRIRKKNTIIYNRNIDTTRNMTLTITQWLLVRWLIFFFIVYLVHFSSHSSTMNNISFFDERFVFCVFVKQLPSFSEWSTTNYRTHKQLCPLVSSYYWQIIILMFA